MAADAFVRPHQCPRCELRFACRFELEDHLATDHPVLGDALAGVDESGQRTTTAALPSQRNGTSGLDRVTEAIDRARGGRIVVGVDESPASLAALQWAVEEAALRQAPLEIVHVWRYAAARGMPYVTRRSAHEAADRVLAAVARGCECEGIPAVTTTLVEDVAVNGVLAAAAEASLLVLGRSGSRTSATARAALSGAGCPIVFVPEHEG